MDKLYDTPIKAIRKKCIDCTLGSLVDIRKCQDFDCPIYPYRMGIRPSEETKNTLKEYFTKNPELAPKK